MSTCDCCVHPSPSALTRSTHSTTHAHIQPIPPTPRPDQPLAYKTYPTPTSWAAHVKTTRHRAHVASGRYDAFVARYEAHCAEQQRRQREEEERAQAVEAASRKELRDAGLGDGAVRRVRALEVRVNQLTRYAEELTARVAELESKEESRELGEGWM